MAAGVPTSLPPESPKDARWYFSKEKLDQTSSRKRGYTHEKELECRQVACMFIQEMGERLNHNVKDPRCRVSQLCMCAAMVQTHRFFVFHPFQIFDAKDMAAAAFFLCAKVEECPRKLEHIVRVWHSLKHRDEPPLEIKSDKYFEACQMIMTYENILLQTIAFDLEVQLPHTFIIKGSQMLSAPGVDSRYIAEIAYFFASDILHLTNFCIRYRPSLLACVCIYTACLWASKESIVSPHNEEEEKRQWYRQVDPQLTYSLMKALSDQFVFCIQQSKEKSKLKGFAAMQKKKAGTAVSSVPSAAPHSTPQGLVLPPPPAQPPSSLVPPALPPPPHPPPAAEPPPNYLRRVKTEASVTSVTSVLDLQKYKQKRLQDSTSRPPEVKAEINTPDAVSAAPRKSFMPDTSDVALQQKLFGIGPSRKEKERDRDRERQKRSERPPGDPSRSLHGSSVKPDQHKRPYPGDAKRDRVHSGVPGEPHPKQRRPESSSSQPRPHHPPYPNGDIKPFSSSKDRERSQSKDRSKYPAPAQKSGGEKIPPVLGSARPHSSSASHHPPKTSSQPFQSYNKHSSSGGSDKSGQPARAPLLTGTNGRDERLQRDRSRDPSADRKLYPHPPPPSSTHVDSIYAHRDAVKELERSKNGSRSLSFKYADIQSSTDVSKKHYGSSASITHAASHLKSMRDQFKSSSVSKAAPPSSESIRYRYDDRNHPPVPLPPKTQPLPPMPPAPPPPADKHEENGLGFLPPPPPPPDPDDLEEGEVA